MKPLLLTVSLLCSTTSLAHATDLSTAGAVSGFGQALERSMGQMQSGFIQMELQRQQQEAELNRQRMMQEQQLRLLDRQQQQQVLYQQQQQDLARLTAIEAALNRQYIKQIHNITPTPETAPIILQWLYDRIAFLEQVQAYHQRYGLTTPSIFIEEHASRLQEQEQLEREIARGSR